jgi:hypothetical protein
MTCVNPDSPFDISLLKRINISEMTHTLFGTGKIYTLATA